MTKSTTPLENASAHASWLPLIILVLAQLQMGFNVNALPVSIGPIADSLNAPATAVSTALVVYSLFVAAFVMLGAKIGKLFGERRVFQVSAIAHGASMALMAFSTDVRLMNLAQGIAGIAAAALVPTLVVLIAANYRDKQQAQAFGILASIPAVSSAVAFVVAGFIATYFSWRYSFGLIAVLSVLVLILSFRLSRVPRERGLRIDFIGVLLSALAIACILFAFNNINEWGLLWAAPDAPFSIFGISPVPFLFLLGLALGWSFFAWSHKRVATNETPLLALEVIDSKTEKNAVIAFLVAGALGTAVSFLVPIYIQFVQDQTPLFTAIAIVPYTLAVAVAAITTVRLYERVTPRQFGILCFILIALGAAFVGFSILNDWGTLFVILGLVVLGVGEGTMLTLLFNVLVSESPKKLAGDVGALRGVANNVSSALGAAFASVVAVGLLGTFILAGFQQSALPPALETEINFNQVDFVSNTQLRDVLSQTSATSAQIDEAVRINEDARLQSLKITFLILAVISLLAILPALGLPKYAPGSISHEEIIHQEVSDYADSKKAAAASQGGASIMTTSSDAARQYSRAHSEKFLTELKEMLRIPSLSGDPAHKGDIARMAEWLAAHMRALELDKVQVMPTAGHPVVYGEWLGAGADKPTVLVYGHYDVVPAALEDGWNTPPFEPTIQDGRIFARGATDDKGQLFIHVKALESYLKTNGAAPVNVKFFLEGEEEIASPNLRPFLESHLDLLRADVCVISDTSMRTIDEPAILHSLRGMVYMEMEVEGPKEDLHSGLWGGAAHNPALALVEILAKLYNEDNTIAVPGFYDDVVPLSEQEREMIAQTDLSAEQFKQSTGVNELWGDLEYTIRERLGARPTLDINGMWSGWSGPGPKTIIPAKAGAKFSSRLVGNQDPDKVFGQIKTFIESITPPTVKVTLKLLTKGNPALIDFNLPAMQAASRAYEKAWGAKPLFTRGGGSIPVVSDMYSLLNIPVVLMGFGLDDDGLHSPNEKYSIEMFQRGIETAIVYWQELAQMPR